MAERNFVVGKSIVADNVGEIIETTVTANTATTVASFPLSDSDTVEFTVKATQGDRRYSSKALALHNGTTVDLAQYGELSIGGQEAVAGTGAITWVTQTSNFGTTNIFDVAYGNSLWVAVGNTGQLRTSVDAITWTTRTSTFSEDFNGQILTLAHGNNTWVAAGPNGIRSSTDGITWTTRTHNQFGGNGSYQVAFGNNLFVSAGEGGSSANIKRSTDGITWTSTSQILGATLYFVGYGNNLWVAGGTSSRLATSTDAITWTTRTSNFTTSIWSVAYGNSLWIASGDSGELRSSTDAITWVTRTSNFISTTRIKKVAYGNGLWVGCGLGGQINTSTDGITWTTRTSNFGTSSVTSVAYGNSLWVASGYAGQLRTSAATTASVTVPLTLSADISGSDVRLRATITDAATTNAEVKVLKTTL